MWEGRDIYRRMKTLAPPASLTTLALLGCARWPCAAKAASITLLSSDHQGSRTYLSGASFDFPEGVGLRICYVLLAGPLRIALHRSVSTSGICDDHTEAEYSGWERSQKLSRGGFKGLRLVKKLL